MNIGVHVSLSVLVSSVCMPSSGIAGSYGSSAPVLWPRHAKSWLTGKDSDAGRDWGQDQKGTTEDKMGGWHHWLNGRESEWTPGVGDGQGGLACCNSWVRKELDTTEQLNWTELMAVLFPVFKGISTLFSIVAVLVCIPTNNVRGFPFLHTLSSIYCL